MLGPLRLQTECDVFSFKRKTRRVSTKPQKRHLFLFDGGVLFCKKRVQAPNSQFFSEYYEHKLCIPVNFFYLYFFSFLYCLILNLKKQCSIKLNF